VEKNVEDKRRCMRMTWIDSLGEDKKDKDSRTILKKGVAKEMPQDKENEWGTAKRNLQKRRM
jgi:hypothetical protein